MASKIRIRRDTAANWAFVNPVLSAGEPGLETDTGKTKYGDGTSLWNNLAYTAFTDAINVVGGIADVTSLNSSGISTLGTVQVSAGIVTATSGIVTYYGDGSRLSGIGSQVNYYNPGVSTYSSQVAITTYNAASSRVFEHYGTLTVTPWTANIQNLNLQNNQATTFRIIGTAGAAADINLSGIQIDGTSSGVVTYGFPMKITKNKTGLLVITVVKNPSGSNYEVYGENTTMF